MVEISDIKDRESLRAWLEALPFDEDENRRIAVTIAHRAAMRVLPQYWQLSISSASARKNDLTALPILRCSLISGVAGTMPTPEIRSAAFAAFAADAAFAANAAANAAAFAANAADAAADAAFAAFAAANAAADADAADAAFAANAAAFAANAAANAAAAWKMIRADCTALATGDVRLDQTPLWSGANPVSENWVQTRETLPEGWDFWRDWYQNALDGVKPNWDMLTEIALIEPADWDKGADHVNGVIAGIVGESRLDRVIADNPYALRVQFDGKHRKLTAHAVDSVDASQASATARQAMKDFTARCREDQSPNGMLQILGSACNDAIKDLRRDLRRYPDNVVALYDALMSAQKSLHQAAAANNMERATPIMKLTEVLDNCAKDFAGSSPALLETLRRRSAVDLVRIRSEQIAMLVRFCNGMMQDSEGYLELTCQIAITNLLSPEADEVDRQWALQFMKAMLPQGAKAVLSVQEKTATSDAGKPAGMRLKDSVDILVNADKAVDVVQEAAAEFGPWAADFVTQLGNGNLPS